MTDQSPGQYEVWITNLDPAVGSEPGKIRPVVVLQSDYLNEKDHSSVIVCVISSQFREGTSLLRLSITPSIRNGLRKQSYILCDHIRAVDTSRFSLRVGMLDGDTIQQLRERIKSVLDLH